MAHSRRGFLAALACGAGRAAEAGWQSMFDGKTLGAWKPSPFIKAGKVRVEDGAIVLGTGDPMTGVTWSGAFPRIDYEIRYQAMRRKGGDFFAALTMPVGESFCTFINGGWGGDVVGISNIDDWDASENETRAYETFENNRWYAFRLQTTAKRIRAWIDEKPVVNVEIAGRDLSLRFGDIRHSAPLGFAAYMSEGVVRHIEHRALRAG